MQGKISVPGGVIAENDWWLADHCLGPYGVGAIVVKTKVHREDLSDISADEAASLGAFLQQLSQAMRMALGAKRVYINLWDDEPPRHVHFLLQPRYGTKEELGLIGLELQVFRALKKPPAAKEAAAAAAQVRQYLLSQVV
ncbi:HIT family protein [Almyronema epifaneia]|uniref:HIT family protein n=1 Tax=Almyronema epifaneia S1 TaxID=2991925 RepID=A0ABW6IBT5_9CYAN